MKNSRTAVFLIAGIFLVLVFLAGCVSSLQKNSSEPANSSGALQNPLTSTASQSNGMNLSLNQFPAEIRGEVKVLADDYSIALNYWEFDPFNDEIDILAYNVPDTAVIAILQGKHIGNYSIHIFNNTDLETSGSEVRVYLTTLKKNPEYQIDDFQMVNAARGPYATLWYNRSTPENKKFDNTVMKGWKIFVAPRPLYGEENLTVSHGFS
jgi:hypothetical protein